MSQLTKKQLSALELVLSGHNLIISGSAGTGKSFLVREIVKRCRGEEKRVSLTCTTGIACAVYEDIQAQTIHHWSGINDRRYSPLQIQSVLKNIPNYFNVLERVKNTDVLVVDECSMMSKKMFNCLNEVCAIKNENLLFGGIQLVLCGDFLQLAPVPNSLCNEDGEYCFQSDLFSTVLKHRVTLTNVFRQSEDVLIKAINEVAKGSPSAETLEFINCLKRPLPLPNNNTTCTKLFATNDHVDDFNRDSLLEFPGPLYEIVSQDSGEKRHLSYILAPHVLWLKIGAPVIFLRNLSDKLVNGLMGEVYDVQEGTVVVDFPSLNMRIPVQKTKFSVYSSRENKDIAVREQLPIKLAFALTIHKSQGMTLDRVEVDCTGIFKPGQLGVAMGRVRSSEGLRVMNFNMRACLAQPETVRRFNAEESIEPEEDKTCCQIAKRDLPVIVTGADASHYLESQGLIKSLHEKLRPKYPDFKLIYYDLGLKSSQRDQLQKHCGCEVRSFPFNIYPPHVRKLKVYAFKPIIVNTVMQEYGIVWWMDASIRLSDGNITQSLQHLKEDGVVFFSTNHPAGSPVWRTSPSMFEFLNASPAYYLHYSELCATTLLFKKCDYIDFIMKIWASCALVENCISPPGHKLSCPGINKNVTTSDAGRCHRYDQSVMNIMLWKMFPDQEIRRTPRWLAIRRGHQVRYFPDD